MMFITLFIALAALAQPRPQPARPVPSRPIARPVPPRAHYDYRPPVRYYSTVPSRSVHISVDTRPWSPTWVPASRPGWIWMPGRYDTYGYYRPGYWRSSNPAPTGWLYVDGFWQGGVYVDGWYRTPRRDGYRWIETAYYQDGSVVPGHWRPIQTVPPGYVWEPGLFDGNGYSDGFWRPAQRHGYRWVGSVWQTDGSWAAGYWLPNEIVAEQTWEPGYFDGSTWVEGRWVTNQPARIPPPRPSDRALALPVGG